MQNETVITPTNAGNATELVASRLKSLRNARGLSRAELSEKSEVHVDTIRRLENHNRSISLSLLFQLCQALGERPSRIIADTYSVSL